MVLGPKEGPSFWVPEKVLVLGPREDPRTDM